MIKCDQTLDIDHLQRHAMPEYFSTAKQTMFSRRNSGENTKCKNG